MALIALKKNRPAAVAHRRFDDQRSPELLADLLGESSGPRHYIVLQLGAAVQFRWDADEPDAIEVGLPAELIPTIPRGVVRDLPRDWVVRSVERELDGDARRTVVRLGRPAAAMQAAA
jgi:hypothetical protein